VSCAAYGAERPRSANGGKQLQVAVDGRPASLERCLLLAFQCEVLAGIARWPRSIRKT